MTRYRNARAHQATATTSPLTGRRGSIIRQAASIAVAVAPFGLAFGVVCSQAGLSVIESLGFSSLVFAGSAQFAAVSVLSDGGTVAAAVAAGALLNLRSLAFGMVMAPSLRGPVWWRALASQLMIDESTAVGASQPDPAGRRFGYLAGGIGVFVIWNATTVIGASFGGGSETFITTAGIDATIPAAFLALLWPRLADSDQRLIALLGAAIAVVSTPFLPAGLPILVAALAALIVRPWSASTAGPGDPGPRGEPAGSEPVGDRSRR